MLRSCTGRCFVCMGSFDTSWRRAVRSGWGSVGLVKNLEEKLILWGLLNKKVVFCMGFSSF